MSRVARAPPLSARPPRAALAALPAALAALALLSGVCRASNPIVPRVGMADPHVHVFNGTFYLYATSDFSINSSGFRNTRWWVWESPDLVEWALASVLLPNETAATPDEFNLCWATDAAQRDGLFFWYLSLGPDEVGVMRSASPVGPWENALHAPLVNKSLGARLNTEARDPGVFADEASGEFYLVFGTFNYYIARLGPDMMSLAEVPRPVVVLNATSQNGVGVLDDKPFLHRKGARFYFSYGAFYGVSDSVYGPFQQVGTWVDLALIAPAFRTNVTNTQPCWCQNEDYNDRHGSFFSAGGQDFWSSNDRSHSGDVYNTNAFRDTILTYVHYLANGSIAGVVIDEVGVGEYRAARVEAENYMRVSGAARKAHDAAGMFFMQLDASGAGAQLAFPHVRGAPAGAALAVLSVAWGGVGGGGGGGGCAITVRARARGAKAAAAAQCTAAVPGGARGSAADGAWAEARCALELPAAPELDVDVELAGGGACAGVALDAFGLEAALPTLASSVVLDDSRGPARVFDGLGAVSGGGATSVLLRAYAEPARSDILDLLFRPGFGASLDILKVEIGGDAQSTDGAEASHQRATWEAPDFNRGYEWWLMKEARARNPAIALYGLPWSFPQFVACAPGSLNCSGAGPWTSINQTAAYVTAWAAGARDVHNLTIDWLGVWNERTAGDDYVLTLRAHLDAARLTSTKIIVWDNWITSDPPGADAAGVHYPGIGGGNAALDFPMWSSEEASTYNNDVGGGCWARVVNQNYVANNMTASLCWNLVASYMKAMNWYRTGLMTALQPWSGSFGTFAKDGSWTAGPMVWATAHTTQFSEPGSWAYLAVAANASDARASGAGMLAGGGSFVTLKNFATGDFSIVIEKMSRAHSSCVRPTPPDFVTLAEDVTFSLRGGLAAARSLALWRTHWAFDDADATSEFERQPDIAVAADGTFALRVEVDSLYTVTTLLAAGAKGAPSAPPPPASQASQFPAWLADDFDACAPPAEADLFCDQSGAFECVESGDPRRGVVMRQMTPVKPIGWGGDVRPHSLVGHRDTVNASLAVSVMLPDANASAVLGLRMRALIDSQGVVFGVNATSAAWSVWSSVGNVGRPQAFASGALAAPLGVGEWHALRLDANGSLLRAWVDGAEVTPAGGLEVGALGASGHAMIGAGDFGQFPLYDAFSLASSATMCDQAAAPAAGLPLATVQCSSEVGVAPLSTFAFLPANLSADMWTGRFALRSTLGGAAPLCIATINATGGEAAAGWPVVLAACAAGDDALQTWTWNFDAVCPQNKRNSNIFNKAAGRCIDMGAGAQLSDAGGLVGIPNEGMSGTVGAPMVATPCAGAGGQSSTQNFAFDNRAGEFVNEGSATCIGVCIVAP